MWKKLTYLLLTLCLIFTVCPVGAQAATRGTDVRHPIKATYGNKYSGVIDEDNPCCWYKFKLKKSGEIYIDFPLWVNFPYPERIYTSFVLKKWLYDANKNVLRKASEFVYEYQSDKKICADMQLNLTAGTYYLCLSASAFDLDREEGVGGSCRYNLKFNYTAYKESFKEINGGSDNSCSKANRIGWNTKYRGLLAYNDKVDFYRFKLSKKTKFAVKFKCQTHKRFALSVYNAKGKRLKRRVIYNKTFSTTRKKFSLKAGTYFLSVALSYRSSGKGRIHSDYAFCLSTKKQDIEVKTTTANLTWQKLPNAKGYQFKLATNKKFTQNRGAFKVWGGSVTSRKIKEFIKGKTYYVRYRSIYKSNGKYVYGKWGRVNEFQL